MGDLYYLMHNNDIAAALQFDNEDGRLLKCDSVINPELLPLGGMRSEKDLASWWKRRAVPITRKGIAAALQSLGLEDTHSLLLRSLGTSLTDHYWVKPIESEFTWEQINLYENDFSDAIGSFTFTNNEDEIRDLRNKSIFMPSSSLQGELQKKWVIGEDNGRYLVKGNYGASCQQSLNEIFAAEIHRLQNSFPYTPYLLTELSTDVGANYGCVCPNFTNVDVEFIPAIDIIYSAKKPNELSELQLLVNICAKYGLSEEYASRFLQYQIEADFVLTNTDRHFNNFGVLRDVKTLKFIDVAPIFDTGNSMFWNVPRITAEYPFFDTRVTSFKKKEYQLLEYVSDRNLFHLDKLPSKDFFSCLYEHDEMMSPKRLKGLYEAFCMKAELLERFQHGLDMKRAAFECRSISVCEYLKDKSSIERGEPDTTLEK